MNYETVELKEKTIVGFSTTTGNNDAQMGEKIGRLWDSLYGDMSAYNSIRNKVNDHAIGLYSDYEGEQYCATAGVEVTVAENPELSTKVIPAGKYAKFSFVGDMVKAVQNAWVEIWKMDLPRSFTGDFEEYLDSDMENCHIQIFVALK